MTSALEKDVPPNSASVLTGPVKEKLSATVLGPVPKRDELVRCYGEGRIAFLRTNGSVDFHVSTEVVKNDQTAHMFFSFTPGNAFK